MILLKQKLATDELHAEIYRKKQPTKAENGLSFENQKT